MVPPIGFIAFAGYLTAWRTEKKHQFSAQARARPDGDTGYLAALEADGRRIVRPDGGDDQ